MKTLKEYMMLMGAEILDDTWMELTFIPLTTVTKKKPSLMDLASGNLESVQKAVEGEKQHKTKMYILQTTYASMGLKLSKHVSIELLPDDTTGGVQ